MTPENSNQTTESICDLVKSEQSIKKIAAADTCAALSFSIVVGTALDIFASRLRGYAVLASRIYNGASCIAFGGVYGAWREQIYCTVNTVEESHRVRKWATDMLTLNTFWTNVYAVGVAASSYIGEGQVDWLKVGDGTTYLVALSPLVGASNGWWMDKVRSWFKINSAAIGAYKNKHEK